MKVLSLLPLLAFGGRTLYHVSDDENSGIRYYDIVNTPTATLTCGETWWELKFAHATSPDGKDGLKSYVAYTTNAKTAAEINLVYANTKNAPDAHDKLLPVFEDPVAAKLGLVPPEVIKVMDPAAKLGDLSFMSWSTAVKVETGDVHYLNVHRPLIGSANATVNLAQNGTLTAIEASVDDQTIPGVVTAVTSLIPVSDIVSSMITPAPTTLRKGGDPPKQFVSYSSVAWTRTYAVTVEIPLDEEKKKVPRPVPSSCAELRTLAEMEGSTLTIAASSGSPAKPPDTTGYTISGSVIPPKAPSK